MINNEINVWERTMVDELTCGQRSWLLPGEELYFLAHDDRDAIHAARWRATLAELVRHGEVMVVAGPIVRKRGVYAIVIRTGRRAWWKRRGAQIGMGVSFYLAAFVALTVTFPAQVFGTLGALILIMAAWFWRSHHRASCPGLHCKGCKA